MAVLVSRFGFYRGWPGPRLIKAHLEWRSTPDIVGAFLWLTRIEDLSKLINVLRGEMTMVGSAAPGPTCWIDS